MYDIRPIRARGRRIWVNSQPSDLTKANAGEFFRAENWPAIPNLGRPFTEAEKAELRAQMIPGEWRGQLELARGDARAWADKLLQEATA